MARLRARPKDWDRFAHWAPGAALLALAVTIAVLVAASLTQFYGKGSEAAEVPASAASVKSAANAAPKRDTDLQLYDAIIERVRAGENYYAVAVEEQRARNFPVRPGLAVRLPTLAYLSAWARTPGMIFLGALLAIATLLAWWLRLRDEPGGQEHARYVLLLLVIGAVVGFKPHYLALHEVWAGMLLALSLGLHRPGHWFGAWCVAALALAIRELALPFVLLLGAMALARGDRREFFGWAGLVILFALGMALHLSVVGEYISAADRASPSWLALRGLSGWTGNVIASSGLHLLPAWLAAPLALLPLLGWAGWRAPLGLTGFLLCLGYGLFFMIAGRDNNFYWALMVMPVWFIGYAFVPRALASLGKSARGY